MYIVSHFSQITYPNSWLFSLLPPSASSLAPFSIRHWLSQTISAAAAALLKWRQTDLEQNDCSRLMSYVGLFSLRKLLCRSERLICLSFMSFSENICSLICILQLKTVTCTAAGLHGGFDWEDWDGMRVRDGFSPLVRFNHFWQQMV